MIGEVHEEGMNENRDLLGTFLCLYLVVHRLRSVP
jgi:hypothetical protein